MFFARRSRSVMFEVAGWRSASRASTHRVCAGAEHAEICGHDLEAGAFLSFFVGPLAGLDAAFQIDLRTLFQVLLGNLRLFGPDNDFVPFGALLALAVLVLEAFIGGE